MLSGNKFFGQINNHIVQKKISKNNQENSFSFINNRANLGCAETDVFLAKSTGKTVDMMYFHIQRLKT